MVESQPSAPSGTPGPVRAASEPTGWRANLPKIPDPIDIDLPVGRKQAFFGWLGLSVFLVALGVFLNWWLTGGAWILPDQSFDDLRNPLGETEVQFLTSHPYDILTASLFVVSTVLLGLSVLPGKRFAGTAPYGWWRLHDTLASRRPYHTITAHRHEIRATGWVIFAFHWAATALNFFFVEDGDWVNMVFAFVSVFVLTYFAYQEFISKRLGKDSPSLHFAAGAVFIAATVWYAFLRVEALSEWIIEVVAAHTLWVLHLFDQNVVIGPDGRTGFVSAITYLNQPVPPTRTVIIILACTAIQSMMIFVAAALAVQKADWRRRAMVIGVTVPIVYVLNLLRNVAIIFLWETRWLERELGIAESQAFNVAHNWIGKVGSLIALVLIALFVFRVLPEVVHAVVGLLDLPRRRGPLEHYYLSLPAGSVTMGLGVAVVLGGFGWLAQQAGATFLDGGTEGLLAYASSLAFIDAALTMLAGAVILYLGLQKRRRSLEAERREPDVHKPTPEA